MSTIGGLNFGVLGIQKGLDGLRRDAQTIASSATANSGDAHDITQALVHLNEDKLQVAASAKVVKAIDEAVGSLFDDFA